MMNTLQKTRIEYQNNTIPDNEGGNYESQRMECPSGGQQFPSSWSNQAVNDHIDDCLQLDSRPSRPQERYYDDKDDYDDYSQEEDRDDDDYDECDDY